MGSIAREDGVLKLVYPGRNVEVHREPITAAQVMNKYPRHSVTRPDVFEYPWFVVKPESVLSLGRVFFVVPNRTIHKLLKSHKQQQLQQHSSHEILSPNKHTYQQRQYQDSPIKINAGSTPKHLNRQPSLDRSPPTTSCMWIPSLNQGCDLRTRKQNKVGSWPEDIMPKNKNIHLGLEEKPVKLSRVKVRSFEHGLESANANMTAEFHKSEDSELLEFERSREVTKLKSCLRKPDSSRRSLRLQVSFLLSVKDEEQQRKVKVSREELPGNYSYSFADFLVKSASLVPT